MKDGDKTPDEEALATTIAALDPAMAIVTSAVDGERAGCLVGFHSQCSIEPNRYAVWLSKANRTYRIVLFGEQLAVHFPSADALELATLFGGTTGDDVDKFARCAWTPGPDGVPLLDDIPDRFVGPKRAVLDDGGDHVCVILEPLAVDTGPPFTPLRLSHVHDLSPGHLAGDRPVPPTLAAPRSS